jgi:hypothetical protein
MICLVVPQLDTSFEGYQGVLVHVTNNPSIAPAGKNPLASQPWRYVLSNGQSCTALYPNEAYPASQPPVLGYICAQGDTVVFPAGPIDRSKAKWTIAAARSADQANDHDFALRLSISDAWFIGNGPS